jgi:hypothetical protein
MKLIKEISVVKEIPLTFILERFDEATAQNLLTAITEKAKEVVGVVTEAYKEEWTKHSSNNIRVVFGHWLVNAVRHFAASIVLSEGVLLEQHDLSVVVDVHQRQIFEIYLQARYYASLDQELREKHARKIYAAGCIDYLEKISVQKDHENISDAYKEVSDKLSDLDNELIDEIMKERKKGLYNWFGKSFSQLAKDVSQEGEDLRSLYQIISAEVHGTWNLALDVDNPEPGLLDFRGYPDKTTLYIRTAETLYQVTNDYMRLWNIIAKSVGAQEVYYADESESE